MRSLLLFPDRDLTMLTSRRSRVTKNTKYPSPGGADVADLELDVLWDAMGDGDEFVRAVAAAVMHQPLTDPDEIVYRQEILIDAVRDVDAIRALHKLAVGAVDAKNDVYRSPFRDSGEQMLRRSVKVLALFVGTLRSLWELAQQKGSQATSPGLIRFYEQARTELGEDYLEEIEHHVKTLGFTHRLVLSASLGPGNAGTDYVLRAPLDRNRGSWWHQGQLKQPTYGSPLPTETRPVSRLWQECGTGGSAWWLAHSSRRWITCFGMDEVTCRATVIERWGVTSDQSLPG